MTLISHAAPAQSGRPLIRINTPSGPQDSSDYTIDTGHSTLMLTMNGQPINLKKAGVQQATSVSRNYIVQFKNHPLYSRHTIPQGQFRPAASVLATQQALVDDDHARASAFFGARGVPIRYAYKRHFNGMAVRGITDKVRLELESQPFVEKVWPDDVKRVNVDTTSINAGQVWAMKDAGGNPIQGKGIKIAIIDSGIDYTRPDLGSGCLGAGCKVAKWVDYLNNQATPYDDLGHGTHVAGIAAGQGPVIFGVAPAATLYVYKVCNSAGSCYTSDIIAALNQASLDGVQVANLSLGGPGNATDPSSQAVDNAVAAGIVMAVAAGNSGPGNLTLGSPGAAQNAITVAAANTSASPFAVAGFSSRGPAAGPIFNAKPDVAAPGVSIYSTLPTGACQLCSSSGYGYLSGTSMATPHVAGAAALLLQAHPTWTPAQVKAALMETGGDIQVTGTQPVYAQGGGLFNCLNAVTAKSLIVPGMLSSGIDDTTQSIWVSTIGLTQTDISGSRSFSYTANAFNAAGVSFNVSPALYQLSVTNSVSVADINSGYLTATSSDQTLRLPLGYFNYGLKVSIPAGALGLGGYVSDGGANTFTLSFLQTTSVYLAPPAGQYSIAVAYLNSNTPYLARRDNVAVGHGTQVAFTPTDSPDTIAIQPTDESGAPLNKTIETWSESCVWPDLNNFGAQSYSNGGFTGYVESETNQFPYHVSSGAPGKINCQWTGYSADIIAKKYFLRGGVDGASGPVVLGNNATQMKSSNITFPPFGRITTFKSAEDLDLGGVTLSGYPDRTPVGEPTPEHYAPFTRTFYFSPPPFAGSGVAALLENIYASQGGVSTQYLYQSGRLTMDAQGNLSAYEYYLDTSGLRRQSVDIPLQTASQMRIASNPLHWTGTWPINGSVQVDIPVHVVIDLTQPASPNVSEPGTLFSGQAGEYVPDPFTIPYQYAIFDAAGSQKSSGIFGGNNFSFYPLSSGSIGTGSVVVTAHPRQFGNLSSTLTVTGAFNNGYPPPKIETLQIVQANTLTDTVDLSQPGQMYIGFRDPNLATTNPLLELNQGNTWHAVPVTLNGQSSSFNPFFNSLQETSALYQAPVPIAELTGGPVAMRLTGYTAPGSSIQQVAAPAFLAVNKAPVTIANVSATAFTSSATLAWTTTPAAVSQILYGPTTSYGTITSFEASALTQHSLTLTGLSAQTTYHFLIQVKDASGNLFGGWDHQFFTGNQSPVQVTINPSSALLLPTATQSFTATVTGSANNGVTWSASTGTISATGLYTAPSLSTGTIASVTATSIADPTKSATALVTITSDGTPPPLPPPSPPPPGNPPVITSQPQNVTVQPGQTATFGIGATGPAPQNYQWWIKTPNVSYFTLYVGATSTSATITPFYVTDTNTQFYCVVSNLNGSVTSSIATLTVAAGVPVITSTLSVTATVGTPFNYQIMATNNPFSYFVLNLPPGISANTTTGVLSGTPTAFGTYSVFLEAINNSGAGTANLTITISPALSPCDVNGDGITNVLDVQSEVNQALALAPCTADINKDGACNILDVQRVVGAVLTGICVSP